MVDFKKIIHPPLLTKVEQVGESALWLTCISDAVNRLGRENRPSQVEQAEVVSYILNIDNRVRGSGRDYHKLVQVLIDLHSPDLGFVVCSYAVELFKGNCDLLADAFQIVGLLQEKEFGQYCLDLANKIGPACWTIDLFYRIIKWNITIIEDASIKRDSLFDAAVELCKHLRKRDPTGERSYYLESELYRLNGQESITIQILRSAIFEERNNEAGVFKVCCPICCYKYLHYIINTDDYEHIRDTCAYGLEYILNADEGEIIEECSISKRDLWQRFVLIDKAAKEAENIRKSHDRILDDDVDIQDYHPYDQYCSIETPITKENITHVFPDRVETLRTNLK